MAKISTCSHCNKGISRKELVHHINAVHKKMRILCPMCNTSYTHPSSVRKHMIEKHKAVCSGVTYPRWNNEKQNIVDENSTKKEPDPCNKESGNEGSTNLEFLQNMKRYKCNYCYRVYGTEKQHQNHL